MQYYRDKQTDKIIGLRGAECERFFDNRNPEHFVAFVDCPDCIGLGELEIQLNGRQDDPEADYGVEECPRCEGRGQIEEEAE